MVNPNLTPEGTERRAGNFDWAHLLCIEDVCVLVITRPIFNRGFLVLSFTLVEGTRKFGLPSRRLAWPQRETY